MDAPTTLWAKADVLFSPPAVPGGAGLKNKQKQRRGGGQGLLALRKLKAKLTIATCKDATTLMWPDGLMPWRAAMSLPASSVGDTTQHTPLPAIVSIAMVLSGWLFVLTPMRTLQVSDWFISRLGL